MCGGTVRRGSGRRGLSGLSPPVRGNRHQHPADVGGVGSIPACAGEPTARSDRRCCRWVYPRVCGGTEPWTGRTKVDTGLSPRVRGNRRWILNAGLRFRSIPACTGEPVQCLRLPASGTVYPRVCGGTDRLLKEHCDTCGLSRRVRGNLGGKLFIIRMYGSIPACAGEPEGWRADV